MLDLVDMLRSACTPVAEPSQSSLVEMPVPLKRLPRLFPPQKPVLMFQQACVLRYKNACTGKLGPS